MHTYVYIHIKHAYTTFIEVGEIFTIITFIATPGSSLLG